MVSKLKSIVPFLDFPAQIRNHRGKICGALEIPLAHGKFILGSAVALLGKGWTRFIGTKLAFGAGPGADALLRILHPFGFGADADVLSAANPILILARATPSYVELLTTPLASRQIP